MPPKKSFKSDNHKKRPGPGLKTAPRALREDVKPAPAPADEQFGQVRINRALSLAGFGSRRASEELVTGGRVKLNGETVTDLGRRVDLSCDKITVDGKPVSIRKLAYYAFYKPRGVVTTMSDEKGRESVFDWIKKLGIKEPVKPAGRLDRRSEGLIILTNDGAAAQRLTHPSAEVVKVYRVSLDRDVSQEDAAEFTAGIELDDGPAAFLSVKPLMRQPSSVVYEVAIKIGRNRIVRRMFGAKGYRVKRLIRVAHGAIGVKGLKSGEIRLLTRTEIEALKKL